VLVVLCVARGGAGSVLRAVASSAWCAGGGGVVLAVLVVTWGGDGVI